MSHQHPPALYTLNELSQGINFVQTKFGIPFALSALAYLYGVNGKHEFFAVTGGFVMGLYATFFLINHIRFVRLKGIIFAALLMFVGFYPLGSIVQDMTSEPSATVLNNRQLVASNLCPRWLKSSLWDRYVLNHRQHWCAAYSDQFADNQTSTPSSENQLWK